jgi:hypothetical protein
MGTNLGLSYRGEKDRLRVSEDRVFGNIFGPKKNEKTEKWSKLLNEKLHDLCTSPNISWVMR